MFTYSFSEQFEWGSLVRTNITQDEVETLIQKYVDEKYPLKVKQYKEYLEKIKQTKIEKFSNSTFANDGLMWQDNTDNISKQLNMLESRIYCKKLVLANRKDWRTPTYDELLSLIDYKKNNPASLDKIEYIIPNKYWSGSKSITTKNNYWYVDFKDGTASFALDMEKFNIRCVREISKKDGEY